MQTKKLILLGDSEVGKTSLIARWVKGLFSEKYIATIGVKIDKKTIQINNESLVIQIWDLQGGTEIVGRFEAYIRGAHSCLFVADGTRAKTLEYVRKIRVQILSRLGNIPSALAINKEDRIHDWQITPDEILHLKENNWSVFKTSAKSGHGVESVFLDLSRKLSHPTGTRGLISNGTMR